MDYIDDNGRLFGRINIVDGLAILLVLAVVAAGTAFVLDTGDRLTDAGSNVDQHQTTVTFEITGVQPYIADAIPEGLINTERIAAVENKSVRPTKVAVANRNGTLHQQSHPWKKTVTLQVSLNTTATEDDVFFGDEPLEVGRLLTLDFGPVTVQGNVTDITDRDR